MSNIKRVTFYPSVLETFDNLPFTEDTIHEYDVELIHAYLLRHLESHKQLVIDYGFKVIDNTTYDRKSEKIENILDEKIGKILKSENGDDHMSHKELEKEVLFLKSEISRLKKIIEKEL